MVADLSVDIGDADDFVFQEDTVDMPHHTAACVLLGVAKGRSSLAPLLAEIGDGSVDFADWWDSFGKAKTLVQWQAKLKQLKVPENAFKDKNIAGIGELIQKQLRVGGRMAPAVA